MSQRTKLMELSAHIRQAEELIDENQRHLNAAIVEINAAKRRRDKLIMESRQVIMDHEAPRCGERWSRFEEDSMRGLLAGLAMDRAQKFGRSTCAIRFRLLKILIEDLIDEAHLGAKITDMLRAARKDQIHVAGM